jgi:hypothetical protein
MTNRVWLLTAVLVLAGCASNTPGGVHPPIVVTPTVAAPAPVPDPTAIVIPKIKVRSSLITLGLNPDHTVHVPDVHHPEQAGFYCVTTTDKPPCSAGVVPGALGPAAIYGHVDGGGQPGVFYRLDQLVPGDEIDIDEVDGTTRVFHVYRVEQFHKADFPTLHVYGDTTRPELRVITCGGTFNRKTGSYDDQILVDAA